MTMSKTSIRVKALWITLLFLFSVVWAIVPGYKDFRFFMSPDEVKKTINEKKYLAAGAEIVEEVADLYQHSSIQQSFTFFSPYDSKYWNFNFSKNIPALKKIEPNFMTHLTERYSQDFMRIIAPAGEGKIDEEWEHQFIFHNFGGEHQLIAISVNFKGEGIKIGNFYFMHELFYRRMIKKVFNTFGQPLNQKVVAIDELTNKHYITYGRHYYERVDRDTIVNIYAQVVVSYVKFRGGYANLSFSYNTSDSLKYVLPDFNRGEFKDVKSLSELIPLQ